MRARSASGNDDRLRWCVSGTGAPVGTSVATTASATTLGGGDGSRASGSRRLVDGKCTERREARKRPVMLVREREL